MTAEPTSGRAPEAALNAEQVRWFQANYPPGHTVRVMADQIGALTADLIAAREALAASRVALQRYGVHEHYACELQDSCSCGLDAALATTRPDERKGGDSTP